MYSTDLPNGTHTIRVVKKSGQFMLLDKLDVLQESLIDVDHVAFDRAAPTDATVHVLREPGELVGVYRDGDALKAAPTTPSRTMPSSLARRTCRG